MEDLEKKLLTGGKENKSKSVPVSSFPETLLASPLNVTACTGPVKLSPYDGKTNWEVISHRDGQSIRGARVTLDDPCELPCKSDIEKLRDGFQAFKAQHQNQEKRNFKCWGRGELGT
ncbi:hypothetical protein TNCV_3768301 [Trichonephila clavipes]|nr:hypothetical protein TNCV_3768301 [Trichonephila clavipes]